MTITVSSRALDDRVAADLTRTKRAPIPVARIIHPHTRVKNDICPRARTRAFRKSTTSKSKRVMCHFTPPSNERQWRVLLLDQNHGEVRVRIMRCIGGTFRNPALEGRRWCRGKCRCGIRLASGVNGSYRVRQAELQLRRRGRYGCILRT